MSKNVLKSLRRLLSEIRQITTSGKISENLNTKYILEQYRKYSVTDQQLCKAQEEMKYLSQTYLCYLNSQRRYKEIHQHFHGKGERTVRATADMVGFKLPHDPK